VIDPSESTTPIVVSCRAAWHPPHANQPHQFVFVPSERQEDPEWFVGMAIEGGKRGTIYPAAFKKDIGIGNRQIIDCSKIYLEANPCMLYEKAVKRIERTTPFEPSLLVYEVT
jgi:hypothetical protein